jgi:hypothetical protein
MIEKQGSSHLEDDHRGSNEALRLDTHGLPLSPQPSNFKDDPLVRINIFQDNGQSSLKLKGWLFISSLTSIQNWPSWTKWSVLLQVGFMALLGPFNAAVANPSLGLVGEFFHEEVEIVTYSTTVAIITGGVAVRIALRAVSQ